jgi:Na+/phosphate symporter
MEYSIFAFSSLFLPLFIVSKIVTWFFSTGGILALVALLGFSGLIFFRARNGYIKKNQLQNPEENISENDGIEKILRKCRNQLIHFLDKTSSIYTLGIDSFLHEDLTALKNILTERNNISNKIENSKENIFSIATRFENSLHSGHYLIDLKDYQARLINSLSLILHPLFEHLSNSHKPFLTAQAEELNKLEKETENFLSLATEIIINPKGYEKEKLTEVQQNLFEMLNNMEVAQIKRIKSNQVNTRNSILFLNIISETKNLLNHASGLFYSYIHLTIKLKNENPTKTENVILI